MPSVSVISTYNNALSDIAILNRYVTDSAGLEAKYQYMISEVVMLRLFSILENSLCDVALKLACGGQYRDGSNPLILFSCASLNDAHNKMISHGRGRRPKRYLQWTTAAVVQDCIQYVLDITDCFNTNVQLNSSLIDEMRVVRNHIAHKTTNTRSAYYAKIAIIYGLNTRLQIGPYLTSTSRHPLSNIKRYLRSVPIIIGDFTKGI